MQLKRLYIKDYKILKDFTIEFPYDFKKYISVFIGANGSGKSTILEAIAEIFSSLFLSKKLKFDFEIEYSILADDIKSKFSFTNPELKHIPVKITGKSGNFAKTEISFDLIPSEQLDHEDTHIKLSFAQREFRNLMPDSIIIYYAGLSEIMEEICKPHEDKLSNEYRKGNTNIDRDFFYYKPEHFGIILLSLLSCEFGDIPGFLRTKAQIERVHNIKIILKEPYWAESGSVIDDFWGASGNVRRFLDFICHNFSKGDKYEFLDYNVIKKNVTVVEVSDEKLQINIKDQNTLFVIKEFLGEERLFFEVLSTMHYDDLIDNINITLIKNINNRPTPFNILSEGEQQAISIRGLTELLSGKNTLFLFDEPDTYIHPSWQRQLINEIEKIIEESFEAENSYLIATHSPQLLSNAQNELNFVKIIENGSLVDKTPKFYGREISSILYNLMGVEERNETIKKDLNNLFILIEDEEITEAENELNRLMEILGEYDPDIKKDEIQLKYLKEDEANNQE